jgi:hypothetical protein
MPRTLIESCPLREAAGDTGIGRTFRARLIEGNIWGSSGYYSNEVLEAAATANVFAAGTQMYLDHPGMAEAFDRPSRSVRDLAGKLTTDAVFESDGLYADIEVYAHVAPIIESMAKDIGLSIRATAEVEQGEAAGKRGTIVREFDQAISVDFVTKAGAGGLLLVESARANARAARHGVAEATVNDTREALQTVLRDTYPPGEHEWLWVRDFDDTTVWFEVDSQTDPGMYGQAYDLADDGAVALAGEREEVRVSTTYVPVNRPDSTIPTTESKEDTMPQIEESELAQLREASGRVTALESERDTERQRAETAEARAVAAEAAVVERVRTDAARRIIGEAATAANVSFSPLEERGLLAGLPTGEDGVLDEAAFRTSVDEQAAAIAESRGAGRPRGFGFSDKTDETLTQEAADEARRQRSGLASVKGA